MIDWTDAGVKFSAAFVAAQCDMKNAVKDGANPAFRSKYATLSAVLEAVEPALNAHGIGIIQSAGEMTEGGYITVETTLLHGESGERITATMPVKIDRQNAQGQGSAMTYGRRYLLAAMCGITQEDDDGNAAVGNGAEKKTPPREINPRETLAAKLIESGIIPNDYAKRVFNASRFGDMTDREVGATLEKYEAAIAKYHEKAKYADEEIPMPREA